MVFCMYGIHTYLRVRETIIQNRTSYCHLQWTKTTPALKTLSRKKNNQLTNKQFSRWRQLGAMCLQAREHQGMLAATTSLGETREPTLVTWKTKGNT